MQVTNTNRSVLAVLAMAGSITLLLSLVWQLGLFGSSAAPVELRSEGMGIDYSTYERALATSVDDRGMVDYRRLKSHRAWLDQFAETLGKLDPVRYPDWGHTEQLAFWINAYNALTLKAIIDHYPIQAGFFKSLIYPKNSIRQIPGVWDMLRFPVLGRKRTLDGIEHEIIRKEFREPRIHFALVCAARGCPPLRGEPYRGESLDAQLQDQTRRFLSDPGTFRINRGQRRVYLSAIFDWFGQDFVEAYGPETGFSEKSNPERAVLGFISSYLSEDDARYLREGDYEVEYLDYDWSLNEQ